MIESSSSGSGGHEKIIASGIFKSQDGQEIEIRDVWASNFDEEMEIIRNLIHDYPYVAMDTEFPGIVAHPVGDYSSSDFQYQTLRCNVDLLKLIQLGLTFTDGEGNFVKGCTCWQFNFKFSLSDDVYAQDSIELLKTSGIDFEKFEKFGIDIEYFGEMMMMSGFDFGYLLKTLTGGELPHDEAGFLEIFHMYFPLVFDVKYMMTAIEGLYGGLSALADALEVERIGPMHQAGSDSLLTAQTYFKMVQKYNMIGNSNSDYESRYSGELFGIGTNHTKFTKKNYSFQNSQANVLSSGSKSDLNTLNNSYGYQQNMSYASYDAAEMQTLE